MISALPLFEAFPSISRLSRPFIITEKLDGTNAQIHITESGYVMAGSRNRWITPEDDNFGFARWVHEHEDELRDGLGAGTHYGEWWGAGIQRRYGLTEKRFSLFNVSRWGDDDSRDLAKYPSPTRPACCHVVPVISRADIFDTRVVDEALDLLRRLGSYAAPGFMDPEGVVVWHEAARVLFKKTLDGDGHKSAKRGAP